MAPRTNSQQTAARGSDDNPMSDRDLEEKLRAAAASWNPRHDIAPLIEAIWRVDENDGYCAACRDDGAARLTCPAQHQRVASTIHEPNACVLIA